MKAKQELECFQPQGIVYISLQLYYNMLQYEPIAADYWQDNGREDLITISLHIQITIC